MPDNNTTALIELWLCKWNEGDESARNKLFAYAEQRLRQRIRVELCKQKVNDIFTDEVFSDLALRLNKALQSITINSTRHFFALATNHIRYALLDLHRKAKRYLPEVSLQLNRDSGNSSIPIAVSDSSNGPERLEDWEKVHHWIENLPEKEREIFDLLFYQELTHKVAAEILGISEHTVYLRWQRVRHHFIQHFGENGPFKG